MEGKGKGEKSRRRKEGERIDELGQGGTRWRAKMLNVTNIYYAT